MNILLAMFFIFKSQKSCENVSNLDKESNAIQQILRSCQDTMKVMTLKIFDWCYS